MTAALIVASDQVLATQEPQEMMKQFNPSIAPFQIRFTSMGELMEFAKMACNSTLVPSSFKGKPGDIVIAIQMGAELGLSPVQSLQSIAVINGKACVYGDAALAIVQKCPDYEYHKEWYTGSLETNDWIAHCMVKRRGSEEYTKSFGMVDAKQAKLWQKNDVWKNYPDRMLQMRARAFCIRDQFADALKGLSVREEVEDYHVTPSQKREIEMTPPIASIERKSDEEVMIEVAPQREEMTNAIATAKNMDELKDAYIKAGIAHHNRLELFKDLTELKDFRKKQIQEFQEAIRNGTFDDPMPILEDVPQ